MLMSPRSPTSMHAAKQLGLPADPEGRPEGTRGRSCGPLRELNCLRLLCSGFHDSLRVRSTVYSICFTLL